MASLQVTTPAHSHPLLAEEGSRSRRSRGNLAADDQIKSPTNYFALKAQLESSAEEYSRTASNFNWDGSVRGYGKKDKRR